MIIGFMRVAKTPSPLAKLTAMLCRSEGINLLYLRPEDVDIEKNIVNGQLFDGDNWIEFETTIPIVIDTNSACFKGKNREIMKYLRENTCITYDRKNSKNKHMLQKALENDKNFTHLVIPTRTVKNFDDILSFIDKYSTIVMKPINSQKGRGVYILRKDGDEYLLGYQKQEQRLKREELQSHFENAIKEKKYMLQKYISSRTKNGDPFDCRVHVQKNRQGKWVVARNYIRIGIGQKVISNVNQGGGISDLTPFLKANFGDQWREINKKIKHLSKTLPYKIEELKGTPSMAIGFDVAIDGNGELYLFESNGAPAVKPVLAKTSLLRVEYYQYLIENVIDKDIAEAAYLRSNYYKTVLGYDLVIPEEKKVEHEDFKAALKERDDYRKKAASVKKERDFYKKKYDAVKTSTSWRLSFPVRKVGNIAKKLKSKR